ncbi:Ribonuclease P protein component [Rhodococcus sp. RD6.2]|uniref:ribonuclease P protein component n=1 Tax=Rhodococcus sp. RD6.2 TaxID=260936 RepID=UPI00063BC89B|nr:ribonuclease P protein component [Rhodococcus sp. RD6.2]CRK53838.1 Ribonuclease P protein component [Rhodococcus sp. RD6.2]
MLPEPHRLRRRADFASTVRRGKRAARQDVVVHALADAKAESLVGDPGPRFGLVVSKAVGPAVIRHRVARRLRHICASLVDEVSEGSYVVIRALPGSATATSAELDRQLRSGLRKLDLLSVGRSG